MSRVLFDLQESEQDVTKVVSSCTKWSVWAKTQISYKMACAPAKTRISLRIRAVWSESSQVIVWVAKDPEHLQADSEGCDQTARMRKLS